ncbi:hypothetical protein PHMEG_00021117 [Phytophthora megakarya]|uniref:Tudor-knot domain-containing protein n=1 Tax=Phytophthora megakarya TaxID=4795 RepID=A0A225VM58_9STRA|nr:hypothetical protein PHMEG_00021117 [Phytophthora megakarya]
MYVTRRLLRSTMPPETEKKEKEKKEKKEVPFLPPPTPKRRAAVRASAKICETVVDASGPTARSRVAKISPKQTENRGDEKNKSRKKAKKDEKKQQKVKKEDAPAVDASSLHGYQLMVDVHYRGEQFAEARVLNLDPEKELVFVHYMGWNARFDAWVPAEEVAAHGSHCGVAKKDVSWDGDTPLFATEEEAAAYKLNGKSKPKKKQKKRRAMSPKARRAAQKALRSVSCDRNRHSEVVDGSEAAQPSAKRVKKSPKHSKLAKKARSGKKVSAKNAASLARRTPRRVQVVVGTMDEDTHDSETADLVLDVEIEGREASNDEAEEDIEVEQDEDADDSPRRSKKRSNKNRSKAVAKTSPLPPRSGRGGLGNDTREKLAAIFRHRVHQRQQMEQLNASQGTFQQSLQDEPESESATKSDTTSTIAEPDETETSMINMELAAAEVYQRQLQQYYYHQQMMLANSMSMNIAVGEDPSKIPLQGGIMDPRIIQERLTALEERRRQQAHVQAYYHQLMLTRERNVRALAANQAFMTSSAAVWEQQMKETQSEDGTSSVASWKDVTGDSSESPKAETKVAAPSSEAGESSKADNESVKESETSSAAVTANNDAPTASPEKAAEDSANTSPANSVSDKSDPADPPAQGVLYEFVL